MPFKSSRKNLISIGTKTLNRKLPLPQVLASLDSGDEGLDLLDKLLNELSDYDFSCLLRLVRMPSDVAVSLMQFFSHEEVLESCKHLALWQQIQFGLRSFCPLSTVWSKKDRRTWFKNAVKHNTAVSCNKKLPDDVRRSQDILTKRHRVRGVSGESWQRDFFNENASIWFLENRLLESLIFSVSGSRWNLEPVTVGIPVVYASEDVWEKPYLEAMAGLSNGSIRRAEILLACCYQVEKAGSDW